MKEKIYKLDLNKKEIELDVLNIGIGCERTISNRWYWLHIFKLNIFKYRYNFNINYLFYYEKLHMREGTDISCDVGIWSSFSSGECGS